MTATLLEAVDVDVRYHGRREHAVQGADLVVSRGDAVGLVGESGCGKTTLARALVGLVAPTRGTVRVQGRPWDGVRRDDPLRRSVQMVFQDPYGSLNPRLTAVDTVSEVIQVWTGARRPEARAGAEALLHEVGLSGDAIGRRPERLSGGQCQRVGIARALAAEPSVLIADEPTSSLDVSVQAQILTLLQELRTSRGLALVLISHDLAVVNHLTDVAIVMYAGRIVERGPTPDLLRAPAHPYSRLLVDSIPGSGAVGAPVRNAVSGSTGCVFAPRCPRMQPPCLEAQPPLADVGATRAACLYPLVPAEQR